MKHFQYYTTNELKPKGWLYDQLRIQADGLHGKLDKIWPDVRDSKWIGGDKTDTPGGIWGERVPYWLDGFIPLAYLLDDADMIARAKQYVDTILSRQKEDGWICPCEDDERATFDPWIILLICKMLIVYYNCSGEERVFHAVYRILKNYYDQLKSGALKVISWGKYRWFEGLISINFMYEKTGEPWLRDLAKILKEQGTDYPSLTEIWKALPLNRWRWETHIVNMAMMLKAEAVSHEIVGEAYTDQAEELFQILNTYHGTAIGLFTGDECLAGISPIHGSELCSVVELMFSYENLFAYTGDFKWLDRMDSVVFNAMPAALDEKMETHQYLQLANQMATKRFFGYPPFRTNPDGAHLFAFDRIWGCCTSNFGQGWPKFALSAYAYQDDTVLNLFAVPSELHTPHQHITLTTNYPFEHSMNYRVQAVDAFTFRIRIPSFVEKLFVDGNEVAKTNELVYHFAAGEERTINIRYECTPKFVARPNDLHAVQWGPLFFSLPVEYDVIRRECEPPYYETEYHPTSAWNYAYCSSELTLTHHTVGEIPFSFAAPPVSIETKGKKIDWGYADGYDSVCAKVPNSRVPFGDAESLRLIPYGCAKLRMTELPYIE
ncbi:MAG: hypothetical protein E7471_06150 [Ruminococcaceae bacterium]|nr:hypothetical protein [Oscillospiraceae bacterium]